MAAKASPSSTKTATAAASVAHEMGTLDFIVSMTGSLAWPLVIVVIVLAFKAQLVALAGKVASFEGFGVKLSFADRVSQLSAELAVPPVEAAEPPAAAEDEKKPKRQRRPRLYGGSSAVSLDSAEGKVIGGWLLIEGALSEAADEVDHPRLASKPIEILYELHDAGVLKDDTVAMVQEARTLRNAVAHGQAKDFGLSVAQQYLDNAAKIVERIRRESGVL